jgi:hypothetical protein
VTAHRGDRRYAHARNEGESPQPAPVA